MSFALQEFSIPALAVQDGTDYTFLNATMRNDSWTVRDPAHLHMINESNRGLLVTMKTGGDSFWLRAGDDIVIPLAPNEVGFSIVCKYIIASATSVELLLLTYFSNRESVFVTGTTANEPRAQ
jgi:hypothetical protein